jgi:hypothetical protein
MPNNWWWQESHLLSGGLFFRVISGDGNLFEPKGIFIKEED